MDASYRSTEVLIWNCHNQHGNQVTFLKQDASHKKGDLVTLQINLNAI